MSLTPGTRIGSCEIAAQIGRGGMGEVHRATDTNLKRQVAIKVLPDAVATDSGRLARFLESGEGFFRPETPQALIQTRDATGFDVTANGQRFLVNQRVSDSSDTPVTVILNWPQLLKK